ncbi:hypothetical protein BOX15_Mlig000006g7, partial [Macrostomum lignano]
VIVIQEANTMSCSRASSATSTRSVRVDSQKSIGHTDQLQNWISERMVTVIEARSNAELLATAEDCDRLQNTEQALTAKINGLLFDAGLARLRRRQVASERWNRKVYEPLQDRIESLVHAEGAQWSLERARMHTEYLETINRRGFHPMDTYSPSGHCPVPRSRPSVSAPGPLAPSSATAAEQQLLLRCSTGESYPIRDAETIANQARLPALPLAPTPANVGAAAANWPAWRGMRLAQIDSPVRQRSQRRMRPKASFHSQVEIV